MLQFLLDTTTSGNGNGDAGSPWLSIGMMVVIVLIFYFLIIRPSRKQQKEEAAMRSALEVGDEVTTIGGIIGKVVSIKDETFVLETTKEKTHIRFLKGAIRSVDVRIADVTAAAEAKDAPAEAAEEAPKKFSFFKKNK